MELSNMSLDWSIGSGVSCTNVTCGIESSRGLIQGNDICGLEGTGTGVTQTGGGVTATDSEVEDSRTEFQLVFQELL